MTNEMTKERATELKPVIDAIVARADGLGMKGKRRDQMALDVIVGADAVQPGRFAGIAFLISVRGYSEVADLQAKINKVLEA